MKQFATTSKSAGSRRLLSIATTAAALGITLSGLVASPASAQDPVAGCPRNFSLTEAPVGESPDRNQDGFICTKAPAFLGQPVPVIDNNVPL
jgi:hypothetical protein